MRPFLPVLLIAGASFGIERVSNHPGAAMSPALAVDKKGHAAIAWAQRVDSRLAIHFRRWNGASWEALAESATARGISGNGDAYSPALALDGRGLPVVAWLHRMDGADAVFLRKWTGSAWAELGGSAHDRGVSAVPASAQSPDIAIDAAGRAVVVWADRSSGRWQIRLRRWNGNR